VTADEFDEVGRLDRRLPVPGEAGEAGDGGAHRAAVLLPRVRVARVGKNELTKESCDRFFVVTDGVPADKLECL